MDNEFEDMDNETIVLINETMNEGQLEKLFALKALKQNPGILGNIHTFSKLMEVLNNVKPSVDLFEPINLLCIAKGVKELNLPKDFDWHDEIRWYTSNIAHEEGFLQLPEILNFAQDQLDELNNYFDYNELNEDQKKIQEMKHLAIKKYLSENTNE